MDIEFGKILMHIFFYSLEDLNLILNWMRWPILSLMKFMKGLWKVIFCSWSSVICCQDDQRHVHVLLSKFLSQFNPDFIQFLSQFYADKIWMKWGFEKIWIKWVCPKIWKRLKKWLYLNFIQMLSLSIYSPKSLILN